MDPNGYVLEDQIASGTNNNKVFIAKCPARANELVAIKHVQVASSLLAQIGKIQKEITGMHVASSEYVVEFHCSFVHEETVWIVMALQEGSIRDVLKFKYPNGFPDEPVIATIIYKTLQGLNFLHEKKMIHRDIKSGNILFNREGHIKLADFGVSALLASHNDKCSSLAGTYNWMAPEVIDPSLYNNGGYDFMADVWSLGITCLELAYGHPPYHHLPPNQVMRNIGNQKPPSLEEPGLPSVTPKKFSASFSEFVSRCLQHEPSQRVPASRLLGHRLFRTIHQPEIMKEVFSGLPTLKQRFETHGLKHTEDFNREEIKLVPRLSFRIQTSTIINSMGNSLPSPRESGVQTGENKVIQ